MIYLNKYIIILIIILLNLKQFIMKFFYDRLSDD